MATKSWAAAFLDPALNFIKTNANKICLCSAEPTTYLGATDTVFLAGTALVSADFLGPADGFASGRKLIVLPKSGITVASTGIATFFALVNTATLTLLYAYPIPSRSLTLSSVIATDSIVIEIQDPF